MSTTCSISLDFLAIPPVEALAKSNRYRSKTNLPTSEYRADSIFLTIPPALNSARSLSQSLRRSDFDLRLRLKFRPSFFSPFHLIFFSPFHLYSNWPKIVKSCPITPFWNEKRRKFASPSPEIHSKAPLRSQNPFVFSRDSTW